MTCACMGPQNGQPLCPCRMSAASGYSWVRVVDKMCNFWQSKPFAGPCHSGLDRTYLFPAKAPGVSVHWPDKF